MITASRAASMQERAIGPIPLQWSHLICFNFTVVQGMSASFIERVGIDRPDPLRSTIARGTCSALAPQSQPAGDLALRIARNAHVPLKEYWRVRVSADLLVGPVAFMHRFGVISCWPQRGHALLAGGRKGE